MVLAHGPGAMMICISYCKGSCTAYNELSTSADSNCLKLELRPNQVRVKEYKDVGCFLVTIYLHKDRMFRSNG